MNTSKDFSIGFIGLGTMGLPMARNIQRAGHPLLVWNRTAQRTEELRQAGAKVTSDPKELAQKASIIITMLAGPPAVEEVVLGKAGGPPPLIEGITRGKILVDMTTNLPNVSRSIAKVIRKREGDMLDAPVSGSVKPATEGTLTILVGGNKETLERTRPVLEAMGKKILHVGGNGEACSMKLALNMHLATMMTSFAECMAFGVKSGLNPNVILEIFNSTVLKNYISETKGEKVVQGDWSTSFALGLMAKDLDLAAECSREIKMPTPLASAAKEIYYASLANGKGNMDFSAVTTQFEQMGNVKISKK